jgi:hypothetical protein
MKLGRKPRTHCPCGVELTDANRAWKSDGSTTGLCKPCDRVRAAQASCEYRARQRAKHPVIERGKRGGQACLERYGREHFAELGRKGGAANAEKRKET